MERWVAKVISLVVIFVLTSVACLLPLRLHGVFTRWGMRGAHMLALVTCFSGGVFLALFLLHMAPESAELINRAIIIPYKLNYPLAEVLVAAAFFLMLFMELWIKSCCNGKHGEYEDMSHAQDTDAPHSDALHSDALHSDAQSDTQSDALSPTQSAPSLAAPPCPPCPCTSNSSSSSVMVVAVALSLHHGFEGLSIGLQSTAGGVLQLSIGVLAHEVILALVLGHQLSSLPGSRWRGVCVGLLCQAMLPVGVMAGTLLTDLMPTIDATGHDMTAVADHSPSVPDSTALDITSGVLHCCGAGVFLYVTFCEMLLPHYSAQPPSPARAASVLAGFIAMALLRLAPRHEHGDHGECVQG